MTRTPFRLLIVALTALTLVLATSPAHAKTRTWQDAVGDTSTGAGVLDIQTVKVTNTKRATSVTVRVPAAVPDGSFTETRVYLDTDPKKKGDEFVAISPTPGFASFMPVKRGKIQWKKNWQPVNRETKCFRTVQGTEWFARGFFKVSIKHKRGCFANPRKVRVRVTTTVTDVTGTVDRDYYPSPTGHTPWVKR